MENSDFFWVKILIELAKWKKYPEDIDIFIQILQEL